MTHHKLLFGLSFFFAFLLGLVYFLNTSEVLVPPLVYSMACCNLLFLAALISRNPNPTSPLTIATVALLFYGILSPLGRQVTYSTFPQETFIESYLIVIIGVIGFWVSILCSTVKSNQENNQPMFSLEPATSYVLYVAGLLFVVLGYCFFILNYARIGGFFEALEIKKIDRMTFLSSQFGNYPYSHFMNLGFLTMLYSLLFQENAPGVSQLKRNYRFWILLTSLVPIGFFFLLEGERSGLLKIGILLAGVWLVRFPIRMNAKNCSFLVVTFMLFSILGFIRGEMARSFRLRSLQPLVTKLSELSPEWFYPREFSATYFALTASVYLDEKKHFGKTYLTPLLTLIPRSVYPGEKPKTISHEFGNKIAELVGRERRFGVGFTPFAEAFVNFGGVGVFLCLFIFGLLLSKMTLLIHTKSLFLHLQYFLWLPLVLLFFRSSFASVCNYIFQNAILTSMYFIIVGFVLRTLNISNSIFLKDTIRMNPNLTK